MLKGTSLVSNKTETLRNTADEIIHDIIMVQSRADNYKSWNKLIVFKSSYSLEIADNGSFWANSPTDTKKLILTELIRRQKLAENVNHAEYAISIFDEEEEVIE